MIDVLYKDDSPTAGRFMRGEEMAQEIADRLGHSVSVYIESHGGSSCGVVYPSAHQNRGQS